MRDSSGIKIVLCTTKILFPELSNKLYKKMKQKNIISIVAGLLVFAFMMFAPSFAPVYAQTNTGTTTVCTGSNCAQDGLTAISGAFPNTTRAQDIPSLVRLIINWALYLSAIIAVIFIIIGGFYYITSSGDSTQATKGRTTLVNALIGLTIIVLSYLIVQVVYNFLTR